MTHARHAIFSPVFLWTVDIAEIVAEVVQGVFFILALIFCSFFKRVKNVKNLDVEKRYPYR